MSLVENLGSELDVLLSVPSGEVAATLPRFGRIVADGLERVRAGDIHVIPGFDGQYGTVRVWPEDYQARVSHETPRLL